MTWKILLILLMVNIAYMLLGGLVFQYLEEEDEAEMRNVTRGKIRDMLERHPCVSKDELEMLIKTIIRAYQGGILATNNASNPSHWDYTSAVLFSETVVTTIGYGHISPSTSGGQAFCVFYAVFGIPSMLLLLSAIGDKLHLIADKFHHRVIFCRGKPELAQAARAVVLLALGIAIFIFIPAVCFWNIEEWTYAESLYYGVITLTTIGFGDFVAGQTEESSDRHLYRVLVWCWLFVGLAWLASIISVLTRVTHGVTTKLENKVRSKRSKTYGAHAKGKTKLGSIRGKHTARVATEGKAMSVDSSDRVIQETKL